MDYSQAIEPVTILKTKSAELIRRARESGQPIVITQNGKATAVLQDVESFQRQRKALLLLKFLAPGSQDLRAGRTIGHSKVVDRLSKKIEDMELGRTTNAAKSAAQDLPGET